MKKILLLVLMVTIVWGLSGCVSTSALQDYKDELDEVNLELEELKTEIDTNAITTEVQLEVFELALEALQARLDNITTTVGLNDQREYYEASKEVLYTMSMVNLAITEVKDTFKTDRAPEYIVDEFGNYVSFEKLGYKLKLKYFNDGTIHEIDMFDKGGIAFLRIGIESYMSEEEIVARMLLMIGELRQYSFYILNCTRLEVQVYRFDDYDHQTKITIDSTVILNDFFEILPDGIYYEDFDMTLESDTELNLVLIEMYYDNFILLEAFNGYVLDFK